MRPVTFGEFTLCPSGSKLTKGDDVVPLQDKPLELLKALVETPGELVSRDALKARLWPDNTFVDFDNNLNATVKKLRDALEDSAERPRFIQTIPRRGYCFVAPLSMPSPRRGGRVAMVAAAVISCALAAAAYWHASREDRPRLVVLPFANLGTLPGDDVLTAGISEEVSTHLGRLSPGRLGVIAHSSAIASSDPRTLDVDYVVEGGLRSERELLRVMVRLVRVDDHTQVWSETYELERERAFRAPQSVAVGIARALAIDLFDSENETLARAGTTDARAHVAYLRGRHELRSFSPEGYRRASAAFREAIALDPDYALARVGMAEVHNTLGEPDLAKRESLRAIAIEPRLAEAHASLGHALFYYEGDVEQASHVFRRALELHPGLSQAHHGYAAVLASSGRLDEAIAEIRHGLELDPLSRPLRGDLGFYYLAAKRFDAAIAECRELLDTASMWARECLTTAHAAQGRFDDATGFFRETLAQEASRTPPGATSREELMGLRRSRLEWTLDHAPPDEVCPLKIAGEYGVLGDRDQAFAWLERAVDERVPGLLFANVDPAFEVIRDDRRFASLMARSSAR